jgi:sporulation protein YqfD
MWMSLFGLVVLQIRSADISGILDRLIKRNISILEFCYIDDITIHITVSKSDSYRVQDLLQKCGCEIQIVRRKGIHWKIKALLRRPVLAVGVLIYLLFVLWVPGRVFFVEVEGNVTVPQRLIIEAAQSSGIHFGVNRREVRSERVKNALLEKIPSLQWAGVNTKGCVAVISVRERQETKMEEDKAPSSIVASRDAIVRQITVLKGTQLCTVGQAVKAGDLLVSGYKDYGISIKLTGAVAAIFGETERKLEAVAPSCGLIRGDTGSVQRKYSLIIGKKQINFYKDSGIYDTSCVKMYKKTYFMLPGGFTLPVALVTQEIIHCGTTMGQTADFSYMEEACRSYLQSIMTDGTILKESADLSVSDDICRISAIYSCHEQIGLTKDEELINQNE